MSEPTARPRPALGRCARAAVAAGFALVAVWASALPAQAEAGRIERVIGAQIEAFLADDFETAFGYASPGIREVFRTAETFGRMVRQGYPMVWRPDSFRFEALEEVDGRLRQSVGIVDGGGRAWVADYYMIEVDGEWRIDGVTLREVGVSS